MAKSVEDRVPLSLAIQQLRLQLMEAMDVGSGEKLRFEVAPVELTLQATVTVTADGKVSWWLVEASGGGARETVQTIKLVLDPKMMTAAGVPSASKTLLDGPDSR